MIWFYMKQKWNRFRKSISTKLFLLMLVLILITTVVMYSFFHYSISSGLIHYVQKVDRQRLEIFSQALEINYSKHKNWYFVTKQSASLGNYLKDLQHNLSRKLVMNDIYMPGIAEYRLQGSLQKNPISINPSKLAKQIDERVALFNVDKKQIAGKVTLTGPIEYRPLTYKADIVGYMGLVPVQKLSGVQQFSFQQNLLTIVFKMALLMLLIMGLFVFFLSKKAVSRILQLKRSVRLLTQGNYDARVPITSGDELGYLMKDMNVLAVSLAHHEKLRKQLFSDVSHDLRTPITVLQTDIESIQDGIRECNMDNLETLQSQVKNLGQLVEDIHELSMSDVGALNYEMFEILLNDPLEETVNSFLSLVEDKELKLEIKLESTKHIYLLGDYRRLVQLFTNILSNSIKYTDHGGSISIQTKILPSEVSISVEDTAPSVPEVALDKLFDRSFRVESSRNKSTGGSGIGLAIAKNIVEAHQGSIGAAFSEMGGISIQVVLPRT